jgi:hypothetical protein
MQAGRLAEHERDHKTADSLDRIMLSTGTNAAPNPPEHMGKRTLYPLLGFLDVVRRLDRDI